MHTRFLLSSFSAFNLLSIFVNIRQPQPGTVLKNNDSVVLLLLSKFKALEHLLENRSIVVPGFRWRVKFNREEIATQGEPFFIGEHVFPNCLFRNSSIFAGRSFCVFNPLAFFATAGLGV